jgi:hypothetical protein
MTSEEEARAAAKLLVPHGELGVPLPAYGGRSLPNVVSSTVESLGIDVAGDPPLLPPLAKDLDPFHGRRAEGPIVLFLVDALPWIPPTEPGVRSPNGYPPSWNARSRAITTVFPTTTTVALASLSTAESPGRHGVVGHRVYLPMFGAVTEILRMAPSGVGTVDAFAGPEWTPSIVSGVPSIFRRGVPGVALTRDKFEPTSFTRMIYDGAAFTGFSTAAEFAHLLAELLSRATPPPLIYAYWDELDTVQHLRGPRPEFAAFESAQVAHVLRAAAAQMDPALARRTTVLLTSDHGQVPSSKAEDIRLEREPAISAHLARPPSGDRRAAFLTARQGHVEALSSALNDRLPKGSKVVPMQSAVDAGLFGPPPFHPELSERLGDLLVLVPSPATVSYHLPGSRAPTRYLVGAHGGLEPQELLVPFVAGSLSELG